MHVTEASMERRLAAILAADAVGYSRMMREDERGALALLQKHRSEVIDPGIAKHRGRTVKLMGDGCSRNSPAWSRPSTVLRKFSVPWLRAMLDYPKVGAIWPSASACISATSWSRTAIYTEMASILPPASKELPASAFRVKLMTRWKRRLPSDTGA